MFLVMSFNSTLTEAGQRRIFQTCWQTLLVSDGYPERILPFFDLYTKELPASRERKREGNAKEIAISTGIIFAERKGGISCLSYSRSQAL